MWHLSRFADLPLARPVSFSLICVLAGNTGCFGDGSVPRQARSSTPLAPSTPAAADGADAAGLGASPGEAGSSPAAPSEAAPPVQAAAQDGARFELAWEDGFDTFDSSRWALMTHSWDTNLAQFSTENAQIDGGILSLALTAEASDTLKPYRGVEMRSRETLTYGKVEARARFARGSGVVSSLVLIYTPWPADDWNELDIEYLGRYADRVQYNAMVYTGEPTTPPVTQSVEPTQFPQLGPLGFDAAAEFHVYGMEWTPTEARFTVDGVTQHVWDSDIARLKLPMNILLTIWASSAADWAGPLEGTSIPVSAEYDWIRVYRYSPALP